jgi:hexosaminidase
MKSRLICVLCCAFLFSIPGWARSSDGNRPVVLEPQPKEVQLRGGGFRVGPATKILVEFGHQDEDRIAAETLAEEITNESGLRLNIVGVKATSKTERSAIVLARLQDIKVKHFLARRGLRSDDFVGDQGYLLFADKTHLVVAANSGQGLFYGVQTLRQLLHPVGKRMVCPSVTIRDWPNLQKWAGDNMSEVDPGLLASSHVRGK